LAVTVAVVAVAGVGAYALRGTSDSAPATAATTSAATTAVQTPTAAAEATPAAAGAPGPAPITASEAPMLDGLPMPPLPYVPQMVPRPVDLVKQAYVFAAQNPGILGYVPCYCGCENNGHVSNVDCFVGSRAPNGAVESWDTHGMT